MRKWIRRSFKIRIFFTVLFVSLLPLFILDGIMLPLILARSESQLAEQARQQLNTVRADMQSVFQSFEEITLSLTGNNSVRRALLEANQPAGSLYPVLFSAAAGFDNRAQLGIFDRDGVCRFGVGGMGPGKTLPVDWGVLRAAAQKNGLVYMAGSGNIMLHGAMAIWDDSGAPIGYIVLAMTEAQLDALFASLSDTAANILLLDAYWHPIYHSQPAQGEAAVSVLRRQLWEGKPLTGAGDAFHFHVSKEEETGFYLVLQKPKAFTRSIVATFYAISGAMSFLCLLLCLWGAWLLSRHLSQPVQELSHAMGEVERGDFSVQIQSGREDELGKLSQSFNRMVAEYQANLDRSVKRQKELNETQVRMMQAQLNPHFLYNTLDTMKWLGVAHKVPQVAALATDLATILRASISQEEMVTLAQELELVERYIAIQSIRFEDRFTCEVDVAEEFQNCLVPKLVLQPLVENAILHGVADLNEGYIKLWAERQEDKLIISVSDNGRGMPKELVDKLNSPDKRIMGGHLGLYNVDSIIRLHFGNEYGITARSASGEGSCVSVCLPVIRREDGHAEDIGRG